MKRTTLSVSGWAVAALALVLLGSARWAASQPAPFPDGAFVGSDDGRHWVVGGGVRHPIAFLPGDASTLSRLPEAGASVASVCEASAALRGADIAASCHAAPPANPAQTLIGQRVTACNYGVDFEIAVSRVEWTKTVLGTTAPGNGMWIVAIIEVTNISTKAEALTTRPLKLVDERGREHNVREYPPDPVDLFRAYEVHAAFSSFEPGITETSVVTFQVPDNVTSLTLTGKRDFC
jgi:hypothetical protein